MLSQNGFDGGVVIFENGADPADMVKDRKIEELEELFFQIQLLLQILQLVILFQVII